MAKKLRNEIVRVELENDYRVLAHVAHDPAASYSRSVGPYVNRRSGDIAVAAGMDFYRRVNRRGWELVGTRHDEANLGDGRAVTVYVLEANYRGEVAA